jgi:hypothetical protein
MRTGRELTGSGTGSEAVRLPVHVRVAAARRAVVMMHVVLGDANGGHAEQANL